MKRNGAAPEALLSGRTVRGVRSHQRRTLTGCLDGPIQFLSTCSSILAALTSDLVLPIWSLRHGILRVLKLAAPQHVSGFRVRLGLHRNAPFLEFLPSCFTSGDSHSMKILKLGAPHRVASFRVRLDLHRNAPFLGLLLLVTATSGDSDSMGKPQVSCPTSRSQLSCSS